MFEQKKIFLAGLILAILLFLLFPVSLAKGESNDCENSKINRIRCSIGLAPLIQLPQLNASSLIKAERIYRGREPWNKNLHNNFEDDIDEFKNDFYWVGENLARNYLLIDNAYEAWMLSPSHKAIIVNPKAKYFGESCVEIFCVLHLAAD